MVSTLSRRYKTFFSLSFTFSQKKARQFVDVQHFWPNVMFQGKAGACHDGEETPRLTKKIRPRKKMFGRDKRSSLLCRDVSDESKCFIFLSTLMLRTNEIILSADSLSNL